jgi:spore coat protein A
MKAYHYPNEQRATTLWYHDHAMDKTAPNVLRGLAGFYLIGDEEEDAAQLPSGEFDIPLLIQDILFWPNGTHRYDLAPNGLPLGNYGGTHLYVNGELTPYLNVQQRKYRFRIANGAVARSFNLRLSDGSAVTPVMTQVGSDLGLLRSPVGITLVVLQPGERFDCVIDFSNWPIGSVITLRNDSPLAPLQPDVLQFRVQQAAVSNSPPIPATLSTVVPLDPAQAVITRQVQFGPGISIGGLLFSPLRVDAYPVANTIEIWNITNVNVPPHPFHMHLIGFQVLSINGASPPPSLQGWKDTVSVPGRVGTVPGYVTLIMKFEALSTNARYVFHCHRLNHEDAGMMSQFQVVAPCDDGPTSTCADPPSEIMSDEE